MKNKFLFAAAGLAALFLTSYAAKNDPVVMTVGGKPVNLSEFEYLYNKNKAQQESPVTLDEYVRMFVDYKLKVLAAEDAGLDTTQSFRTEIDRFAKELAQPYLVDSAVVDSLRRLTYDRMHTNVDISHILIGDDRCKTPEARKALADSLRNLLEQGADFADLARRYSSDKSAAVNGGHLGYISVGMYPYAMEDVAYSTPAGKIAPVFESRYGAHLLKVNDTRADRGKVKARHIVKIYRNGTSADTLRARLQIDSIRSVILSGADFSEVARQTTDEPAGRKSGGELPWFGSGQMVPAFESAVFALADGQLSHPVETSFGVHLIMRDSTRTIGDYQSTVAEIDKMMARDDRSTAGHRRMLQRLGATTGETDRAALEAMAIDRLDKTNSEYRNLVKEYHDGLLLYEISDREVWGRANNDIDGLRRYFENHRDKYRWDKPRFKGYLLMAGSDSLANQARQYVADLKTVPDDSLQIKLRRKFGNSVRLERVLAAEGANPVIDYVAFGGPRPKPVGKWSSFVPCRFKIAPQPEVMEDVKGLVSVDYQKQLETDWMERLYKTYRWKVNDKVLKQVH